MKTQSQGNEDFLIKTEFILICYSIFLCVIAVFSFCLFKISLVHHR